ncbi:MAG: diguanylate cyclase [Oscillospiraceae bacterium]|nr:diguanylate cyclase [Oscillospiraceae bacterium]
MTVMSVTLIIGLAMTGAAVIMILMDTHETSLREYAVLGLFCAILTMISYYVELQTPGLAAKIDAVKFGYIGKVFVNPLLLMLAVRFYEVKVPKLWQTFIYLVPIITLYLVFTCERSGLYYQDISLGPDGLLLVIPGPAYHAYVAYNTLLAMIHISFCLYQRPRLRRREKNNNTILILANIIPFLSLMVYLAGWTKGFDISTIGIMVGALCVTFSIFRYGLLNKEGMLQNMATGLIFLDGDNRLIYANRKAVQIIPALGTPLVRTHKLDLKQLCSEEFASIQVGSASYQRKITEWSNGEGHNGKLLTFDDITEIRARLNRDAMTGLLNHASFYPMLDDAMAESKRTKQPYCVSIADINSFKLINDTYGHSNGDIVLTTLADTLYQTCGQHGDVFRYGGEEFAVIFHCGYQQAEEIMQYALDEFSAISYEFMDEMVSFSYGTAEYDSHETSVDLFDRADQLMYKRKKAFHDQERAAQADT